MALCAVLATSGCGSSPPAGAPRTEPLPSAGPDLHFEPHGLYGHINGGAELFLEFGFASLDVRSYLIAPGGEVSAAADSQQIDVELYRMTDAAAALGIYLAKCGKERPQNAIEARHTANAYQLTAVAGTLFLQVNNFSGEATNLDTMIELANGILAKEKPAPPLAIWKFLPEKGRISGSEFLFRGRFGLEPVYTFGSGDVLQIEGRALGAGARYDDGDGKITRHLTVVYPDAAEAAKALAHLQDNLDPYLTVIERETARLVFKDYAGEYGSVHLVDNRLDIAVRLEQIP
jgi:Family of unknown function (DUF6599)